MTQGRKRRCPLCKSVDFDGTQYYEEGGFCNNCNFWVVPQASAKHIFKSNLHPTAKIQFHKNGIPTFTWEDYLEKMRDDE